MTTQEVANRLVELCRQGAYDQALSELYSSEAESLEPAGSPMPYVKGMAGLIEKGKAFNEMVEQWHGGSVSDPIVAGNFFSVTMMMDVTLKGKGREEMDEVCVYEVKDGKVVKEQFFF